MVKVTVTRTKYSDLTGGQIMAGWFLFMPVMIWFGWNYGAAPLLDVDRLSIVRAFALVILFCSFNFGLQALIRTILDRD